MAGVECAVAVDDEASGLASLSFGVLAASLPRDVIDEVVAEHGRGAKRSDSRLPAHLMVYFACALALWADEDYEQVMTELAGNLGALGGWSSDWEVPTSGGITRARKRLGPEVVADIYDRIALPVGDLLTPGAFMGHRRLVSIDGFTWDLPDTPANDAHFGRPGGTGNRGPFPQARIVTLTESGTHATLGAAIGPIAGKETGERALAVSLYPRLEPDSLLLADRGFYSFQEWCTAADLPGVDLLWRLRDGIDLPLVETLADGSFTSLVFAPRTTKPTRERLLADAKAGRPLPPDRARPVRVVEYDITDAPDSELFCLISTVLAPADLTAVHMADAYQQRWEHELGNRQLKTYLRGPGRIARSKSPDMVLQEIHGYLIVHHAISALIARAATESQVDPDRVKFTRTVHILRRSLHEAAASPPPGP